MQEFGCLNEDLYNISCVYLCQDKKFFFIRQVIRYNIVISIRIHMYISIVIIFTLILQLDLFIHLYNILQDVKRKFNDRKKPSIFQSFEYDHVINI